MDTTTRSTEAPFEGASSPVPFCSRCGSPNVQTDDDGEILYCRACRSSRERRALEALANVRADLQDALRFLTVHDDRGTAEEKMRSGLDRIRTVNENWAHTREET